jgi:predicted metal-dependent phosphoesterase TrpH
VGTDQIVVELDYDRAGGENAIDYAMFDARFSGRNDDLTGYRGKNPNRAPLVSIVGKTAASYGHLAGPMPEGTWRVMFYVYKTVSAGVDVTARISIVSEGKVPPQASGPRWLRGDLHMHTLNSDGSWTVASLAAAAQEAGLDFIAITDHNVASHHFEIARMPAGGPLILNGVEITTYGGHMNAWGMPAGQVPEHRQLPGDNSAIRRLVGQVHAMGALLSINHPYGDCKACDWQFDKSAAGFDSIEVWNGAWSPEDEKSLAWWDSLLRGGRRITAVGSSDSHAPENRIGVPTVHLYAAGLDQAGVLQAIAAGKAVITASPDIRVNLEGMAGNRPAGPGEELTVNAGTSVHLNLSYEGAYASEAILRSSNGEAGRWDVNSGSFQREIPVAASGFYRLEIRDRKGLMLAMTNPVWIRTL